MASAYRAAQAVIRNYEQTQKLLPLAGGIPQPIEQSDDHAVVLARSYLALLKACEGLMEWATLGPDGTHSSDGQMCEAQYRAVSAARALIAGEVADAPQ